MFAFNLLTYAFSFALIWFGAGLIVSSTSKFAEKLRLSGFLVSFFVLGLLTSTPEFSVGLQAVNDHNPGIFVGNLLGGVIVIFLFIIPLLAIFGNGISLRHEFDRNTLFATLGVILAPSVVILDKRVTNIEGGVLIALYLILLLWIQKQKGLFDRENSALLNRKSYSYKDILKIIAGVGIVFLASNLIVDRTVYFANFFNIPTFYVSLLVVALGTDLPEISLAIRSVISGKKDIAMGDYLGAGAASTLLFGLFTLINDGEVLTGTNFLVTFLFTAIALSAFFFLSQTKKVISRRNGFLLILVYISFVVVELAR